MSGDGVWAFKLVTKVIPSASAQISNSDASAFILFVYHPQRRLVQPNATVTVKLYRADAASLIHLRCPPADAGPMLLRGMITLLSLTTWRDRRPCLVPVNKLLRPTAVLTGLLISSMFVVSGEAPAQTSIQNATSGDAAVKINHLGNDSHALQESTGLDPAAATKAWLDSVPQDKREKSDAYFEGGYWLLLWNYLLAAAISILLLASRISAWLRDFSERLTKSKTLQVVCYSLPYLLLVYLLSFPLNIYEHFFREHQYGLATQNFIGWFREQLIGLGIALIGGTIFLIVLYSVFRRAPKTWWIWGTVVAVVSSFFLLIIAPVFIEPLFNTYRPLTKPEISEPILAMARANQIPVKQVFEVDASRQTTRVSANVSGILGTTRIALNDNLLNQCTIPEIRAVMAHEMGHYVLNHGAKLLTYLGIFMLIGFALTRISV